MRVGKTMAFTGVLVFVGWLGLHAGRRPSSQGGSVQDVARNFRMGCYMITDRDKCCQTTDQRPWKYTGQECVPAPAGKTFSNGRVCQPRCWAEGTCVWNWGSRTAAVEEYDACPGSAAVPEEPMPAEDAAIDAAIDECWTKDRTYEPLSMFEGDDDKNETRFVTLSSPKECQKLCQATEHCAHFSYWQPLGHCYLQDEWAISQPTRLAFLSGPRYCKDDEAHLQKYHLVDIGKGTLVPKRFECIGTGVSYQPILPGITKTFKGDGWHTVGRCAAYCQSVKECHFYSMSFLDGTCELSGADAYKVNVIGRKAAAARSCGL